MAFGLGPFPGRSDRCVAELFGAARRARPSFRVAVFAYDLRLVDETGDRTRLSHGMARLMGTLPRLGVLFYPKESKRWWPREVIPWLAFEVGAKAMRVRLTSEKHESGKALPYRRAACAPGSDISATEVLQRASYLDFLEWMAPGGFFHFASGWGPVNRRGVAGTWGLALPTVASGHLMVLGGWRGRCPRARRFSTAGAFFLRRARGFLF